MYDGRTFDKGLRTLCMRLSMARTSGTCEAQRRILMPSAESWCTAPNPDAWPAGKACIKYQIKNKSETTSISSSPGIGIQRQTNEGHSAGDREEHSKRKDQATARGRSSRPQQAEGTSRGTPDDSRNPQTYRGSKPCVALPEAQHTNRICASGKDRVAR